MTTTTIPALDADTIRANRKAWTAALRSGKYAQTDAMLYNVLDDAYCCLGVASVLCGLTFENMDHNDGQWGIRLDSPSKFPIYEYLTLPEAAQEWLGVNDANPSLDIPSLLSQESVEAGLDDYIPRDVASLNDQGLTFAQIADLVDYFGFTRSVDVLAGAKDPWA